MIGLTIVHEGRKKMPTSSKEVVVKENQELTPINKGLSQVEGLAGFEDSDLPIPMIKLVTNRSEETLLQNGEPAPVNQFHHTGNKVTINPFIFRIVAVAKGEAWSDKANNGQGAMIKKIVFYGFNESDKEMFFFPISSSYAYWEFRKRVLPILNTATKAGHNIVDVVLQGDKATADNKSFGKVTYPVFKLVSVKPLDEEQRAYLVSVQAKFSEMALANMKDAEDVADETKSADASTTLDDVQLPA